MTSKVVSSEDCRPDGFRWLTLKKITWEDPSGRQRLWESAERTTRQGDTDGVAIVAKIIRSGQPPLLPVLKQFRPPVANYCLELPAGLVDSGESAGQAAVRELLEETGYHGRVTEETSICVSDPGMSNANMRYVTLEVDGDAPEHKNVAQRLEDGEFIQVELVPWAGLMQHLQEEMAATACEVDARLLSYAYGLHHAMEWMGEAGAAAAAGGRQVQQENSLDGLDSTLPLPFGSPLTSPHASLAQPADSLPSSQAGNAADKQERGGHGKPSVLLFMAGAAAGVAACLLLPFAAGAARCLRAHALPRLQPRPRQL